VSSSMTTASRSRMLRSPPTTRVAVRSRVAGPAAERAA
jgi:hypothetical protein